MKKLLPRAWLCSFFLLLSYVSFAQETRVTGQVTDSKNQPLPGVNISLKGTSRRGSSDGQGNYSITVTKPTDVLVFSTVGYLTQEVNASRGPVINIQLQEGNQQLDDVVVVGYGTQRRRDLTGSVASVKGDVFKNQPITNALEGLQGRVAGVNITKNSGAPDAAPSIIIRGLSTLYQPNPLYIVDGIRTGDIANLNVQDIESVDVLKDASAASIYGAAAAGGVLIITTRKGTTGVPKLNYNSRYGITTPKVGKLLDKQGYIDLQNIISPQKFAGATRLDTLANTDWVDAMFRNGVEQNHAISFSGGAPVVDYLVSGFYNRQQGVAINNYSNIGGARINTNYKIGKGNWLKFGEQLSVSRRTTSNPQNVGIEAQLHNSPFRTLPIIPLYEADGSFGRLPAGYTGIAFSGTHPLAAVENAHVENFRNNFQGNLYAEIKLPFDLTFRTTLGYSYYNESQNFFQNAFTINGTGTGTNALNKFTVETQSLLNNYVLTYNKTLGQHNLNAVAGFEQISGKYNNINVTANNVNAVAAAKYALITTALTTYTFAGRQDNNALIKSFFGRVNYNYKSRYFLSGSIRQDANFTVFGPNKQKGVFPAASAGWNISDEPFFKSLKTAVSNLKFRASYGELGNSNIGTYSYLSLYQPFTSLGNGSAGGANFSPGGTIIPGSTYSSIPNPDLHWETVKESNIGVDGDLFNGKLYFSAEVYNKNTVDMLYALPLAPSAGISGAYLTNIGTVNNKGLELMIGYRGKVHDLGFDVNLTAAWNKNQVTKLSDKTTAEINDGYNYYNNGDAAFQIMPNRTITLTRKGLPFGSFYGLKSLGIFQSDSEASSQKVAGNVAHAGDLHYEDVNKDGVINDADRQIIGNPNPKLVYGASIRLNYKRFDASFLFNGVAGVDLFNGVKAYEMRPFSDGNTSPKVWGDSFLKGNGLTSQPRLGITNPDGTFTLDPNGNYSQVSSYFVENGAYLKLKNLQLGYTFSSRMLQHIKMRSARIFVMGNNLFTITKYTGLDPELGASYSPSGYAGVTARGIDVVSQYPQTRIYSVGIDVNF